MLCGVTATLGSNPSATATAARPQWGRAVLLCLNGVWARARVCVLGPGCLVCPWAAGYLAAWCARGRRPAREPSAPRASLGASSRSPARPCRRPRAPQPGPPCPPAPSTPAALVSLCVAGRVASKPGQAPPPPTGPAAWPSVPSGTLHTGGACVAVTSPARPYRMGTAAWVSGLSTQWCPVADADWCVVSKLGQAPSPPMGTAAWPSGTLRTGGACVAVTSPARPCRRPRAPQPTDSIAWPSKSCGALHTGRANPLRGR